MPGIQFKNNAYGTIAGTVGLGDLRTNMTIALTSGHGARFPSAGAGDYFMFTLINTANVVEHYVCVARSNDSLTCHGAQEGSGAAAFLPGDRIELRVTGATLTEFERVGSYTGYSVASGTPDALTATVRSYQSVLSAGTHVRVLSTAANTTATPTLTLIYDAALANGPVTTIAAKTIVKGNNEAVQPGDIPSASYLCEFAYNSVWGTWVLLNPYTGLNASFIPPGVEWEYWGAVSPSGWIFASGRTIGDAVSGGTERANGDTLNLFTLLWNSTANTELPVLPGGRGSTAAADYAAHKTIQVPDSRGRVAVGRDDMGGSSAARLTANGFGAGGTIMAKAGGADAVALTTAQLASHTHQETNNGGAATLPTPGVGGGQNGIATAFTSTQLSFPMTTLAAGGGQQHSNTQPSLVKNKIIKL